jgi:hypothetical protein
LRFRLALGFRIFRGVEPLQFSGQTRIVWMIAVVQRLGVLRPEIADGTIDILRRGSAFLLANQFTFARQIFRPRAP